MKTKLFWILGGLCVVNFAAHLCCYPLLPQTIPTHWNAAGVVDGWGPKYMALVLAALPALLLVLLRVVPMIDPKSENYGRFAVIYQGFTVGITLFMVLMTWLTELWVFGFLPDGSSLIGILVSGGIGVLFILLGNYMPRIRQNYSFGCRTPWALADEHNWNRTQRMGGIVFVVLGVFLLLLGLFSTWLGSSLTFGLLMGSIIGGSLWIYLYSFLVFKGLMK